jgi:hypothetical protein
LSNKRRGQRLEQRFPDDLHKAGEYQPSAAGWVLTPWFFINISSKLE